MSSRNAGGVSSSHDVNLFKQNGKPLFTPSGQRVGHALQTPNTACHSSSLKLLFSQDVSNSETVMPKLLINRSLKQDRWQTNCCIFSGLSPCNWGWFWCNNHVYKMLKHSLNDTFCSGWEWVKFSAVVIGGTFSDEWGQRWHQRFGAWSYLASKVPWKNIATLVVTENNHHCWGPTYVKK